MEAGRESSVMKMKPDYLLLKRGFATIFNLTIKHYNTNLFFRFNCKICDKTSIAYFLALLYGPILFSQIISPIIKLRIDLIALKYSTSKRASKMSTIKTGFSLKVLHKRVLKSNLKLKLSYLHSKQVFCSSLKVRQNCCKRS